MRFANAKASGTICAYLLFDTGNGIDDIASVVATLTGKPVSVLNSHTHYDHVGGNYQFDMIYGMNTGFTRVCAVTEQACKRNAKPQGTTVCPQHPLG